MVRDWRVLEEVETLSDHRYIRFDISASPSVPTLQRPRRYPAFPRWSSKSLDRDLLMEASVVQAWACPDGGFAEVEDGASWFRDALSHICDASMSRAGPPPPKRQVYWWSEQIGAIRTECTVTRRQYTRYRRRQTRDPAMEAQLYSAYREQHKALQLAISRAKTQAREELLEALSRDPWGRPYLLVRGKLRAWAPPLTQSLEPRLLGDIVSALFPDRADHVPPAMAPSIDEDGEPIVEAPALTPEEFGQAVTRLRGKKNKAPGPDGIPGHVWVLAMDALGPQLAALYNSCLQLGRFPPQWKTGRLVLIKKDGRPAESPSAYRPIVLLDEVGKLFERIIAARLVAHLSSVGPDLSQVQFGFREGRSTIDAIVHVKTLAEATVSRSGVVLAVSLDIKNAFNTLPWGCIREALRYHKVPSYLRRLIGSYLSNRYVEYLGRCGRVLRREMSCGVPQGSVLGPLLWNIGYDWVLRGALPPGLSVSCYADDTLVLARGDSYEVAARLATAGVATVVGRIRMLGLEVELNKTEALCFHGPRRAPPANSTILVEEHSVEVGSSLKYLGLVLDSRWNFREHFARLVPRLMGAAAALARLMPNLRGPDGGSRRLYLGVVRSMALYGAPIWADTLTAKNAVLLRKPQRAMAVRVIRGYHTISFEAACVLARSPPWDLEAGNWSANYWRRADSRAPSERRFHSRQLLLQQWENRLFSPSAGLRTVEAVRPVLLQWLNRRHGALTFHLTQILTGHGCFGKYLCRIAGKEPTTGCHACGDCDEDTAQHTLAECTAWDVQRRALVAQVGHDLSLPAVVKAMVGSRRSWQAVLSFCEDVMTQKEAAERERELDSDAPACRRRRTRRRSSLLPLQ